MLDLTKGGLVQMDSLSHRHVVLYDKMKGKMISFYFGGIHIDIYSIFLVYFNILIYISHYPILSEFVLEAINY